MDRFKEALENLYEKLSDWVEALILSLPNVVLASLFLVVSFFLARYLRKVIKKLLDRSPANQTVSSFLGNLAVSLFILFSLFVVLNILNLSEALTALLGTAGVAGLAVGLALQDPLINLFSGVLMSVREYYKIGDLVESNGYFGVIQKVNLRTTVILLLDGQEVVIPNKDILQNPLKNYSHNKRRRVELSCGVSYDDDLEKVKKVAIQAVEQCGLDRNETRPIELYFTEFGDSSINFTLRFWKNITEQKDYLSARDQAIIALKKAFDEKGITIPFPIRTLDF